MRSRGGSRQAGFSLIELLTVIVVIGILASIALPLLRGAIHKADAATIVEDGRTILLAGVLALHETGQFPGDAPAGVVPADLAPYLATGFDFDYEGVVTYKWESDNGPTGNTAFLYIDYSAHPGIARAMQVHDGNQAIWTDTEMIMILAQ